MGDGQAYLGRHIDYLPGIPNGGIHVDNAFAAFLRRHWKGIPMDRIARSALIVQTVDDFERHAKREFEDPSEATFVWTGRRNWSDEGLGIVRGNLEISGYVIPYLFPHLWLKLHRFSATMEELFQPTVDVILNEIAIELQRFNTPTQVLRRAPRSLGN